MFRKIASMSLTSVLVGAAALAGASLFAAAPAAAFDGYGPRGYYDRPHGWRPPPPPFHGYWGHRHWRRHHDGYGFRPPPPPPGYWR
jgi:Spy/CpxP family protein refolding chaperone